jgi:hypothetical protein
MKTRIIMLLAGIGLLFAVSCSKYPPSSDRLLEDLAVVTQYDTKIDFNDYKTFSIVTSIVKITDKDTTVVTTSEATNVLNEISKNMVDRGFTKVDPTASPDFGIDVVYYENTYVTAYYGGYYWGYPYYGYYYPYYPVYYSTYTAGAGNIQLVDLKHPVNQQFYLRWNAFIRGLMTGTHTNADIMNAVDQAFIQTPELKTTPIAQ